MTVFARLRSRLARRRVPPGCRVERLERERGFRLVGELDLYTVEAVRAHIEPELQGTLVFDLSRLDFIDDSGLGFLLTAFKRLRQQDGSLVIRNPTDQIARVFEITGIDQIEEFTIERDTS